MIFEIVKTRILPFILAVCMFSGSPLAAQPTFFETLPEGPEPLELTLRVDLKKLIRHKFKEEYYKGHLFFEQEGQKVEWPVKVRTRGNIRKQICFYPPLLLKFKKDDLKERGLREINKFKLVVNCRGGNSASNYVHKELLAYKLYNVSSNYSFRTKPLIINFTDPEDTTKVTRLQGLIIENEGELAERLSGTVVKRQRFSQHFADRETGLNMAFFQFMIGNTDWALGNLHNMKLLKVPERRKVIAVPYDFDYSGLVDASYAVPHESLPIKQVSDRHYLGLKCNREELAELQQKYGEERERFLDVVRNYPALSQKEKASVEKYILGFYDIISNAKKSSRLFLDDDQ